MNPSRPDTEYYDILELSKTATTNEIKKSFRKKAMKEHPDRGGDAEKFKKISQAYEILSNDKKREVYDKYGKMGLENSMDERAQPMNDIFEMFGQKSASRPKKSDPITKILSVDLKILYNGITVKQQIERKIYKAKSGKPVVCAHCNGKGYIESFKQIGPGMLQQVQKPCHHCNKTGYNVITLSEIKTFKVVIEKGMKDGQKIKIKNEGDHTPGGTPGDIIFVIKTKPHSYFKRENSHLLIKKNITLTEALCGTSFHIKHLDGRYLNISTKTNTIIEPDSIKVIKGEGMPLQKNPFNKGNLVIYFSIQFPKYNEFDHAKLLAILPKKDKENKIADAEEYTMEDFHESMLNNHADNREYDSDEENERRHPGHPGQGVQCAQS